VDRDRFSYIAHTGLEVAGPIRMDALMRAVAVARPLKGQRAIDVGCGKAALLLELARVHGVRGLGIERSKLVHAHASRAAATSDGLVDLMLGEADPLVRAAADASLDLGICIGSGHALGGYEMTLQELARVVRPGGHILVGEGYWKKPPSAEYLAGLGGTEEESRPHRENVDAGVERGLVPLLSVTATEREWDEYEWAYSRNVEEYAAANPLDPDVPAMLERIRAWRRLYLREGRETLGFGIYLFRRP
jgi:SAM-dependent methyltransferase